MSPSADAALKINDAAPLFAALGDRTRLKLISRLSSEGPLSIVRLSEGSDVTRQAITKHLRALADAGLIHDTRRGRETVWEFCPKRLEKAREHLDQISRQWETALGRLKDFLDAEP